MKIASFFAGCGGLDLGFRKAGFDIIWANEFDPSVHRTYQHNHPLTKLCKEDIRNLIPSDIPDCDGFIGGPPCQSWSLGGKQLGLADPRGKLFITYLEIIKLKKPKFFVIENVEGIISERHNQVFISFISFLGECGYKVYYDMLNATEFRIPQDRKRVFIVGFRDDLDVCYTFPEPICTKPVSLREAIGDICSTPNYYTSGPVVFYQNASFKNHDVYNGSYDLKFMSRNRVRSWDEPSYTIQAQAKNCPLHPQAPKMKYIDANHREFVKDKEHLYRRFSVRECARIQTFPDSFHFIYDKIEDGYKMVGNAVPPRLAYFIALSIKKSLLTLKIKTKSTNLLVGYYKNSRHLDLIIKNQLYYVRTGLTRGALKLPIGIELPKFLILHNKRDFRIFSLSSQNPSYISAKDLRAKGFTPSHSTYLCFNINEEVKDHPLSNIIQPLLDKITRKVAPKILTISW
ncbi:MAG: DNA cytosine methyltransferase [Muribaculaceae bacterium]|nr:DNA cytosine methyltransferase [Muribaculaceae bacterium]